MAESQALYSYDATNLGALRAAVSDPRFGTYMRQAGFDAQYAFALYLFNARMAKAFLFPLHMAEIVLRNAIDEVLCVMFGPYWHLNPSFRNVLMPGGVKALQRAIDRVFADKGPNQPRGQIVATLTFDFWSNLFRPEYDRPIWQTNLHAMLPNLSHTKSRHDVQNQVKGINRFRNRVAHYEPILGTNFTDVHGSIIDLIASRSQLAANWTKHHSTFTAALRTRPGKSGAIGSTFREVCDARPRMAAGSDSLAAVLAGYRPDVAPLVRLDATGVHDGALSAEAILAFIVQQALKSGGIIDLNDHSIDDVFAEDGKVWAVAKASSPASELPKLLKGRVRALVVCEDTSPSTVVGVIAKAH